MSNEQDERLKQLEAAIFPDTGRIVPALGACFVVSAVTNNVLDFHDGRCTVVTLSLLDSEAAERDVDWALRELADGWIDNNQREGPYGFNQNARRVLGLVASDAATTMRDRCLENVRTRAAKRLKEGAEVADDDYDYSRALECAGNQLNEVADELQSITLETEQQK